MDPDAEPMIGAVLAWHRAVNRADLPALDVLVTPDVDIAGLTQIDSGGVVGLDAWIERTRIQIVPRRVFARGQRVVVEQSAAWWLDDTEHLSDVVIMGCVFDLADGRITRIARYPDVARALEAGGLTDTDMVIQHLR